MRNENGFTPTRRVPVAVVLGTNDIASAVAHRLFRAGYGVVMSRDPGQPVLRRSMAYDDALVTGFAELEGTPARSAHTLVELLRACTERSTVCVTTMELGELLCLGLIEVLVDARMRMRTLKVDIRPFARLAVGLGPGFAAGRHVDAAVETAPEAIGVLKRGATLAAHGRSSPLGGAGRERFARAPVPGCWLTDAAIGDVVSKGQVIGLCGSFAVLAPLSGRLRGLVRSGAEVPSDLKLVEVDPRRSGVPSWLGIAERAGSIADAAMDAIDTVRALRTGALSDTAAH